MKFTFNGRKLELSEEFKAYAEKKLSKLDKFFNRDAEAVVLCRLERGRFTSEVTVRSANLFFRAQNTANDLYATIDAVEDMIERQIRKNKTKLEKRLREGAFTEPAAEPQEPEEDTYDIVRRKRFHVAPMDVEEAILQMNMLGHQFYAFLNADDNDRYCVVYRRNDGGYGLIETE